MTNLDDFDRSLGDFLADGPNTAPEAPVIAALAHARTTRRRHDPFAFMRSDVMSLRRGQLTGLRPGLVLAAIGLLVAAVGVTAVGSRPQDPSIVPGQSVSPAPSPSTARSAESEPSSAPSATPATGDPFQPIGSPAMAPIRVVLGGEVGNETSVDVVDESGLLVSAVAGPNTLGQEVQTFDASNDAPNVIRLTWPGAPCDTVHRLTIDATMTTLTLDRPNCYGDSMGYDRSLILTFQEPVDAASLTTTLYAGRGGVDMPTWTATAPDSGSGSFALTLADPGYVVDSLEGHFDPEREASGAGPTGIVLDQVDPSRVGLVWLGSVCATDFQLTLDPAGDTWTLRSAPCEPSGTVLRMVDVVLRSPRAVETIKIEARVGEPRG